MGVRAGTRFVLRITYSDTIINYRSCQKLKLIGIGEFNHLMNMLAFFYYELFIHLDIPEMQFPRVKGLTSHQYTVAIRLTPDQSVSTELQLHQQSARTSGRSADKFLSSELELVNWNEVFFFKVDSPVCG